jgi:uncharacterized protein YraI
MVSKHSSLSVVLMAILMLALAALACNAPEPTPAPPSTHTLPPPQATATKPSELVTPVSSAAPTAPAATASNATAATKFQTNIRSGPSTAYTILGTVAGNLPLRLTGRNADKTWWQIEFSTSPDGRAWVYAENVQVNAGVNVDALPVITVAPPPSTPTSPPGITATPRPSSVTATPKPSTSTVLRADTIRLTPGQCTTLRWDVDDVRAVFLNVGFGEEPVGGHSSRPICPDETTVYYLHVVNNDGRSDRHALTVMVSGACGDTPIISRFESSATAIHRGESVTFYWDVACAKAVYFRDMSSTTDRRVPVGGHDQIKIEPAQTTTYRLIVVAQDNSEVKQEITVTVSQ